MLMLLLMQFTDCYKNKLAAAASICWRDQGMVGNMFFLFGQFVIPALQVFH